MDKTAIDFYTRLARGLAAQFGSNCEIVIHDLESNDEIHKSSKVEPNLDLLRLRVALIRINQDKKRHKPFVFDECCPFFSEGTEKRIT